jgi:pullulanase/glycogen debranching enzyme
MDYFGAPGAGYASDPQEVINYAAAHDNETLFDISQYKLPHVTSTADRVRVATLANSIVLLSQGIPFLHAGQDMLRSKSTDRNSYDSGDWFNILDFTYRQNGWGRGLPPAADNQDNWAESRILLADPSLGVGSKDIMLANRQVREFLRIRKSSRLFRMRDAGEIIEHLKFHNTGPGQIPGLVVMSLSGEDGVEIVVLFNAGTAGKSFIFEAAGRFELHPVQRDSIDPVVRTASFDSDSGQFYVPARTTAVFVRQ